eukprot:2567214-Rhodomonas_salina.2
MACSVASSTASSSTAWTCSRRPRTELSTALSEEAQIPSIVYERAEELSRVPPLQCSALLALASASERAHCL